MVFLHRLLALPLAAILLFTSFSLTPPLHAQGENFNTPRITSVTPDPGQGILGDPVEVQIQGISVGVGALSIYVRNANEGEFDYLVWTCKTYTSLQSREFDEKLIIPSTNQSIPYVIGLYWQPNDSRCDRYTSYTGAQRVEQGYQIIWQSGGPLAFSVRPIVTVHSTSARISWQTTRAATTAIDDIPDGNYTYNATTRSTGHIVDATNLFPGREYSLVVKSCADSTCISERVVFTTTPGCTILSLLRVKDTSQWETLYRQPSLGNGPLLDLGEVLAGAIAQVRLNVVVDNAAPSALLPQWTSTENVSYLSGLQYQIKLPDGLADGALRERRTTLLGWEAAYQADTSVSDTVRSDGDTKYEYIPPATVLRTKEINVVATITTSDRGRYDGTSCGTSTPSGNVPHQATFSYNPAPIASGKFTPIRQSDVEVWNEIKDQESQARLQRSILENTIGFFPKLGDVVDGLTLYAGTREDIQEVAQLLMQALGIEEYDSNPNDMTAFNLPMLYNAQQNRGADLYWQIYTLSGVNRLGQTRFSVRRYYILYTYTVKGTNEETGELEDIPVVYEGVFQGLPLWLIKAGGAVINDGGCCSNEMFVSVDQFFQTASPVRLTLTSSNGQQLGQNVATLLGGYGSFTEPDGTQAEVFSVPRGDYDIAIQGIATDTFSLFATRPIADTGRSQVIIYRDVPIRQNEVLSLRVPLQGTVPPIILASGTRIWPFDNIAPTTQISVTNTQPSPHGWYNVPPVIQITAEDDLTGVASTSCSLQGGGEFVPTKPITVTTERADNMLICASRDMVGNAEVPLTVTLPLDLTPPQVVAMPDEQGNWVPIVTDALSGPDIASMVYSIDGATWAPYATPIATAAAPQIQFRAKDRAGNETASLRFTAFDTSGPAWRTPTNGANGPKPIRITSQTPSVVAAMSAPLSITGSSTITVSAWLRSVRAIQGTTALSVTFLGPRNVVLGTSELPGPSGNADWTAVEGVLPVPVGAVRAKVAVVLRGWGEIRVDDLTLITNLQPERNLLRNGDLEQQNSVAYRPSGWKWDMREGRNGHIVVVSDVVHGGRQALALTAGEAYSGTSGWLFQDGDDRSSTQLRLNPADRLAITPGVTVTASIATRVCDSDARISLVFYDAQGKRLREVRGQKIAGRSIWTTIWVTAVAPKDAASVDVVFTVHAPRSQVWADDIVVGVTP